MFSANHQKFIEMDELSLQKVPYFFIIDFLTENVEIFKEDEIENSGLLIDFQNFSNVQTKPHLNKKVEWISYPETLESFKTGFDKVQKNIRFGNSYLVNYTRKTKI